jgi:hypothetical protein
MEPTLVLKTATVLLGIAAVGGLVMAVIRFAGAPRPPSWLAMVHGLLAGAALTLLIYTAVTVGIPVLAKIAVALFLVAAAGGAFLNLKYHAELQPLPKAIVLVHGAVAVVGFGFLVVATWM